MEARYRLGAERGGGGCLAGPSGRVVRAASCVLLAGLLAGCEPPPGGASMAGTGQAADAARPLPGKLAIIVNLAAGDGAGATGASDDDSIAAVTARIMERLKAVMPAEEFAAIRTFNLFPAIALSADGELIARILAMPEVVSIERDHELQLEEPGSGLRFK